WFFYCSRRSNMKNSRELTVMALFVAIGTLGSQFIWFPAGIAKAYPVQHAVNVLAAIMLGPGPAVAIAFVIGLLRNMLGRGSLLAFPGGMIGAFVAGMMYRHYKRYYIAAIGEVIGTGIIGALFSVPFAKLLMGTSFGALFFIPPFIVSSVTGSLIAILIASRIEADNILAINQ